MKKKQPQRTYFEEMLEAELESKENPETPEEGVDAEAQQEPEAVEAENIEELPTVELDADAVAKERDELKDQLLRARAEFDNYRKRVARDTERVRKMAAESLVRDLLPVVDHLELALQHAGDDSGGFAEGVAMVGKQFSDVLAKHGVEVIPAKGEAFDPNVHEAMMQRACEDAPEGTVVEEFQRGYRLGEMVLRPSKVVVSSGSGADATEPSADGAAGKQDDEVSEESE